MANTNYEQEIETVRALEKNLRSELERRIIISPQHTDLGEVSGVELDKGDNRKLNCLLPMLWAVEIRGVDGRKKFYDLNIILPEDEIQALFEEQLRHAGIKGKDGRDIYHRLHEKESRLDDPHFYGQNLYSTMGIRRMPDVDVIMNSRGFIEVKASGEEQTIGTGSLGGCLAIAAIVQDKYGDRRCSLGHYDPMTLRLELEGYNELQTIRILFNQAGKVGRKADLEKTVVLVMSRDPEGQQNKFVRAIEQEANYILGCKKVTVVKYGEYPSDYLHVRIGNASTGNPDYATVESTIRQCRRTVIW